MSDCLGVSLILREILKYFPTPDLLQLSLVNKLWNYEARSMLRDRGTLTVSLNKWHKCSRLKEFASDLQQMKELTKVVPFSGMNITFGEESGSCDHDNWSEDESSTREMDQICDNILHHITWKHLKVTFVTAWMDYINCPGLLLLIKVHQSSASVLEEISIQIQESPREFFQVFQDHSFPCLKTLKFQDKHETADGVFAEMIKAFVSRAPNLQLLYTEGPIDLWRNLLEGSSAMHVTNYPYSPSLNHIPESVARTLRMKRMQLVYYSREDFNVARFHRITSKLLRNSRATLVAMEIDPKMLVPLKLYGVCMENLRTLELDLDGLRNEFLHSRVWSLVESFDFTRMFPNLSTVCINQYNRLRETPDEFWSIMVHEGCAAYTEPTPDRADNIKNAIISFQSVFDVETARYLALLFPKVQKLSVAATKIPFCRIWDWQDLEELDVKLLERGRSSTPRYDSAFCGIFPEELAELQGQDEDYLRSVNIVPVMPSITCLKGLRTFNFFVGDPNLLYESIGEPTFVLSKVTGLVAFDRLPALSVTFTTDDQRIERALAHLKPYASVRCNLVN